MNYKRNFIIFTFCSLFSLVSCGGGSSESNTIATFNQKYFFSLIRCGLGGCGGYSVDASGEVNFFVLDDFPATQPTNGLLPESYLDTIFNDRKTFLEMVDGNVLSENKTLIEEASLGILSNPLNICFDAGEYTYSAYTFDINSGFYREVIIYKTGDFQSVNPNSAAVVLRDWMIEIAVNNNLASPGDDCTGDYTG